MIWIIVNDIICVSPDDALVPYCRRHIQMQYLEWMSLFWLKFNENIFHGSVNVKPLPKRVSVLFTYAYMYYSALMIWHAKWFEMKLSNLYYISIF